jgi:hypothetical protein
MTFHLLDGDPRNGSAGIESFTEQRWVTIQHSGRPAYPF